MNEEGKTKLQGRRLGWGCSGQDTLSLPLPACRVLRQQSQVFTWRLMSTHDDEKQVGCGREEGRVVMGR